MEAYINIKRVLTLCLIYSQFKWLFLLWKWNELEMISIKKRIVNSFVWMRIVFRKRFKCGQTSIIQNLFTPEINEIRSFVGYYWNKLRERPITGYNHIVIVSDLMYVWRMELGFKDRLIFIKSHSISMNYIEIVWWKGQKIMIIDILKIDLTSFESQLFDYFKWNPL